MGIGLWIAQAGLAVAFGFVGIAHSTQFESTSARPGLGWMHAVGKQRMAIIGVLEMAAAVGLIAPALTGIQPWLTPLAAAGLVMLMLSAAVFHLRRPGEMPNVVFNLALGAVAVFVAVGRSWIEPL